MDTSQVTDMFNLFTNDYKLEHINGLQNWDVSHVNNMAWTFNNDSALQDVNIAHWDVNNVQDTGFMFDYDNSLNHLDLSNWDNSHTGRMTNMLGNMSSLKTLTLGDKTHFNPWSGVNGGNWTNNGQTISDIQIQDRQVHPGTWVHQ